MGVGLGEKKHGHVPFTDLETFFWGGGIVAMPVLLTQPAPY